MHTSKLFEMVKEFNDAPDRKIQTNDVGDLIYEFGRAITKLKNTVEQLDSNLAVDRLDLLSCIGDVQILLWTICQKNGVCFNSWNDAIRIKHSVNMKGSTNG
jgi:hypothetical protein